jgi:uncharacterized paraquat-inducible protein A
LLDSDHVEAWRYLYKEFDMARQLVKVNKCKGCGAEFVKALLEPLFGAYCPVCQKTVDVIEVIRWMEQQGLTAGQALIVLGVAGVALYAITRD